MKDKDLTYNDLWYLRGTDQNYMTNTRGGWWKWGERLSVLGGVLGLCCIILMVGMGEEVLRGIGRVTELKWLSQGLGLSFFGLGLSFGWVRCKSHWLGLGASGALTFSIAFVYHHLVMPINVGWVLFLYFGVVAWLMGIRWCYTYPLFSGTRGGFYPRTSRRGGA